MNWRRGLLRGWIVFTVIWLTLASFIFNPSRLMSGGTRDPIIMSLMAFDVEAAKAAGATDQQIASYLARDRDFDLEAARKAGVTDAQIIAHLAPRPSKVAAHRENLQFPNGLPRADVKRAIVAHINKERAHQAELSAALVNADKAGDTAAAQGLAAELAKVRGTAQVAALVDVQLPDGTVVKNVPDGTTRSELADHLEKGGYAD